jgi:alpha-1,3-rhamnosyl/mannosyltransferase
MWIFTDNDFYYDFMAVGQVRIGFGATVWTRGMLTDHLDGIGVYTERLWREFVQSGVDVHAVAFGISEEVKADSRSPKPLECVDGAHNIQSARSILCGFPFRGTHKFNEQFDVFHATDHHIPKLRGVPVVATIMDAIPFIHPEWVSQRLRWAKNVAFRKASHWAEHIITISEFSKRDIIEEFGISERNITVIPLGYDESLCRRVDYAKRQAILQQYGLSDGFFLFVGTLQPRKNVRRLIAAHRSLNSSIRSAHPLVIVGNFGWGDEAQLQDIDQMERQGHGRWLRRVPQGDLVALMQSATALVYPSLYEGFGLPVLEGFAAGIPVVSSNTTSIPEVAGDAAMLVNPLDTEEIAHAMSSLVEDEHLAMQLVLRGNERLKHFSWQACASKTIDVYRAVI